MENHHCSGSAKQKCFLSISFPFFTDVQVFAPPLPFSLLKTCHQEQSIDVLRLSVLSCGPNLWERRAPRTLQSLQDRLESFLLCFVSYFPLKRGFLLVLPFSESSYSPVYSLQGLAHRGCHLPLPCEIIFSFISFHFGLDYLSQTQSQPDPLAFVFHMYMDFKITSLCT